MKLDNINITNYSAFTEVLSRNILESDEFEKIKDSILDIEKKYYPNGNIRSIKFMSNNEHYIQLFNEDGTCKACLSGAENYMCDYYYNSYIMFSDCVNKVYTLFVFEHGNLTERNEKPLNDSQVNALKNIYLS